MFFRVLPLHHTAIQSQWKESDLLLVLLMNVILSGHLLHGAREYLAILSDMHTDKIVFPYEP